MSKRREPVTGNEIVSTLQSLLGVETHLRPLMAVSTLDQFGNHQLHEGVILRHLIEVGGELLVMVTTDLVHYRPEKYYYVYPPRDRHRCRVAKLDLPLHGIQL